ncbi:MAG: hypothetical protein ACOYVK_17945 [Bacillota bacterium]
MFDYLERRHEFGDEQGDLVDLVKDFISFSDHLLSNGVITKQQYYELVQYKMEFLQKVDCLVSR